MDFLETVRATIGKYRMLKPRDRILVAVSGGPDSMALLTALVALRREYRVTLRAAYVDHGLRPAAARREAAFVKKISEGWKIPVDVVRAFVRKKRGKSLEEAAREARYGALAQLAVKHRAQAIALGHTRDDQAETLLMWLIRGTGTTGLAGIPPVRKLPAPAWGRRGRPGAGKGRTMRIIRPLLDCSRAQILQFLHAHRMGALKDRSNDSLRFLRNRVRKELIPLLEREYNPQVREHLGRLAQILQEDLALLEGQFRWQFARVSRMGKKKVRLNRLQLRIAPGAVRRGVIRLAVKKLKGDCHGFGARHWMALDQLLFNGMKAMDLPGGFRAEISDEKSLVLRSVPGTLLGKGQE